MADRLTIGAGVSTAASIPDFRSASGLFSGSKGGTVKDLFHVKSLSVSYHSELELTPVRLFTARAPCVAVTPV